MRERAPTKTLLAIIQNSYRQQYQKKYQERSAIKLSGVQRTRLKEMIDIISVTEICRRLEKYFNDKSDWLAERCHPWNVFVANIDQYGGKNGKGKGRYVPGEITEEHNWIDDEIENYQRSKNS